MKPVPPIWLWDHADLFKVGVTFGLVGVMVAVPGVGNIRIMLENWRRRRYYR
jgi:predicted PurR-regulated permease PerM